MTKAQPGTSLNGDRTCECKKEHTLRKKPATGGAIDKFVSFVVRFRIWVSLFVLVATVLVSLGTARLKTEVILQHLFPQEHPYLQLMDKFSKVFGSGGSGVAIAVNVKKGDVFNEKTLTKVKGITDEIVLWDEVYRTLNHVHGDLLYQGSKTLAKGEIRIEPLMFPDGRRPRKPWRS